MVPHTATGDLLNWERQESTEVLTLSNLSLTTRTKEVQHCGAYANLIGFRGDVDVIANEETLLLTVCS